MAKRGHKPVPTAILKLRGSPCAKGREDEPQPDASAPMCPRWLDAAAKAEWRRLVPQLQSMGVLAKTDLGVLAGYCRQWSKWVEAERALIAVTDPSSMEHRRISISSNEAFGGLLRTITRLGLSPSDRVGLKAGPKTQGDDELSNLLNRRGRKKGSNAG